MIWMAGCAKNTPSGNIHIRATERYAHQMQPGDYGAPSIRPNSSSSRSPGSHVIFPFPDSNHVGLALYSTMQIKSHFLGHGSFPLSTASISSTAVSKRTANSATSAHFVTWRQRPITLSHERPFTLFPWYEVYCMHIQNIFPNCTQLSAMQNYPAIEYIHGRRPLSEKCICHHG